MTEETEMGKVLRLRADLGERNLLLEVICGLVLDRALKPGRIYSESQVGALAASGGFSAAVRDALALLATHGVFDVVSGSGYRLRTPRRYEIEQLNGMRCAVECTVVDKLARVQEQDLGLAWRCWKRQEQALKLSDWKAYGGAETVFWCALAEACGMPAASGGLRRWGLRAQIWSLDQEMDWKLARAELALASVLLGALVRQDPQNAVDAVRALRERSGQRLAGRPQPPADPTPAPTEGPRLRVLSGAEA